MYVSATSTRLSRGMSTPAKRAMMASPQLMSGGLRQYRFTGLQPMVSISLGETSGAAFLCFLYSVVHSLPELVEGTLRRTQRPVLALTLLVARVGLADDHDDAVATNHLAVLADRLDARVDLHCVSLISLSSYPQSAAGRYFPAGACYGTTCSGRRSDHGSGRTG